uniref:Uncharacterized protein n=1 Tax=Arundo donax TaxID=35708 RepID=A0A0A9BZI3_ARUDO
MEFYMVCYGCEPWKGCLRSCNGYYSIPGPNWEQLDLI